jgi:uncharacterized membrane protein YvbJ
MKKCPYCFEKIKKDAIKCRFCGEFFKDELLKNQGTEETKEDEQELSFWTSPVKRGFFSKNIEKWRKRNSTGKFGLLIAFWSLSFLMIRSCNTGAPLLFWMLLIFGWLFWLFFGGKKN